MRFYLYFLYTFYVNRRAEIKIYMENIYIYEALYLKNGIV